MDFGTLLSVAQKNENNKQSIACYQTKFTPPKKPSKQAKALSQNIRKFLARKEEEERQKALEEKKKRENLLALRDHKAQSRINKHLKVCKAANKSVLADAIDNENTAVTMAGPSQPDEDDYGYVSQEASAFYNQLMSKYNNIPSQNTSSHDGQKKTIKDIASTKDRVKQALKQQEVEEALGHRRKRKLSAKEADPEVEEKPERDIKEAKKEKEEKTKPKKKHMPPPIDFTELLKIAEKKQHEPIIIDVKPKNDEPERLFTKKQMKEYAKEKEWRERKEQRNKVGSLNGKEGSCTTTTTATTTTTTTTTTANKPNKIQESRGNANSATSKPAKAGPGSNKVPPKTTAMQCVVPPKKTGEKVVNKINTTKYSVPKTSERDVLLEERKKLETERKKLEEMRKAIEEEKKKLKIGKNKIDEPVAKSTKSEKILVPKTKPVVSEKQELLKRTQTETPTASVSKARMLPMMNDKPKQLPPSDVKLAKPKHTLPIKEQRKSLVNHKRRIPDEDHDDEEYDSELDDFIDDDVPEQSEDYSKYISEIFGYDKSRYKHVDIDDAAMESSFAQQLKEEYVSTKIGIMEDLEDMRMEALEKKRKAFLKKKCKK